MNLILNKPLISVSELSQLITEKIKICIFDCRFNMAEPNLSEQQFAEAHIPGAQFLHIDRDLADAPNGSNGRHPLPNADTLTKKLISCGLNSDSLVVAYDADNGAFAARLWWLLRWLGHSNVCVLDGGMPAWLSAGKEVTSILPNVAPGDFAARIAKVWLSADEVAQKNNEIFLVDARSPERFRGEIEPMGAVAGHIPHAKNRFFKSNLNDDGFFKTANILREEFLNLLADHSPSEVVHSCGSGITACHNILAMEYAGLSGSRLYPGSWSEWSSNPQRPVERG